MRGTDPKAVQEKAAARAKEAGAKAKEAQETFQTKVNEFITSLDGDFKKLSSNLDADLKKFGESAQDFALRGVGVAAEYAVKAREAYEKVAEHGEQAVRTWRGEAADEIEELAVAVEPDPKPVVAPVAEPVVVKARDPGPGRPGEEARREEGPGPQDHHREEDHAAREVTRTGDR